MPEYKLMYDHSLSDCVESFKYMFHYGDINFDDVPLSVGDSRKCKIIPNMPTLKIDGKKYDEELPIGRYIAKKCMLYGSDEDEAFEIDVAIDIVTSIIYILKSRHNKEVSKHLPHFLNMFEEQVKKNGGYSVRGKLSWADILYAAYIGTLPASATEEIHKDHPVLKNLVDTVHALPKIKAYLDKRPKTSL